MPFTLLLSRYTLLFSTSCVSARRVRRCGRYNRNVDKMFRRIAVFTLSAGAIFAQGIPGVIAPDAKVELVQEGFVFTEGPVATADGGLYFSDLQSADRTYRMEPNGKISIFREHTNGMNGMALAPDGGLLGVEGTGKRVSRVAPTGNTTTLTEGTAQRPLMGPNDLIADQRTGIYFTDPGPRPIPAGRKSYVYYLAPNAKDPTVIDDSITRPNGIVLCTGPTGSGKTTTLYAAVEQIRKIGRAHV